MCIDGVWREQPCDGDGVNCSGNRNENEACWLGEKSLNWGSGNSKEKGLDEFRASGIHSPTDHYWSIHEAGSVLTPVSLWYIWDCLGSQSFRTQHSDGVNIAMERVGRWDGGWADRWWRGSGFGLRSGDFGWQHLGLWSKPKTSPLMRRVYVFPFLQTLLQWITVFLHYFMHVSARWSTRL